MILPICESCPHGSQKDGRSYCKQVNMLSYLTSCIQKEALAFYLQKHGLRPEVVKPA